MRPVKVQYRIFKRNADQQGTAPLAALIRASLDQKVEEYSRRDITRLRQHDRGHEGAVLFNRCDEFANWVFGETAIFNPGKAIEIIEDAENARVLNLAAIPLGQGRHPVKGVIYWLAVDDHVLAIQAPNISLTILREHLTWLLCEATNTVADDIALNPMIEIDDEKAPPVKDIVLSRTGEFGVAEEPANKGEDGDGGFDIRDVGRGFASGIRRVVDMMRAAGISEANIDDLAQKVGNDGELIAELHIRLKKKGRRQSLTKIDALGLMGDIEQDVYKLRGEHGTYKGKATRITYNEGRVEEIGPFLMPDDARRVLIEAYRSFRANGRIEGSDLSDS